MFEAEAIEFQSAGIQIGADAHKIEEHLMEEVLSPFGVARRNSALEMARLYAILFCFENEIRDFIRETLSEKEGSNWINNISPKIKQAAEDKKNIALKDSWLEGEKTDILGFFDFGHLSQVIINKWEFFENIIPSQHWLKQRMEELEKVRNFIAHNRMLLPSEFQRVYMYIADWNHVIGL